MKPRTVAVMRNLPIIERPVRTPGCALRVAAHALLLLAVAASFPVLADAIPPERCMDGPRGGSPAWTNVTHDLGGDATNWGYSTITLGVAPGTDTVYAHIGNRVGLFATRDGGEHWERLAGPAEGMAGNVSSMLFDPQDPRTFWVCCWYGRGLVKTTDAGKTFLPLRTSGSYDEYATIDFSDPERKTLVIAKHEGVGGLQLSRDGGMTRTPIGDNLPKGNATRWPVLVGPRTILTSGVPAKPVSGIWRSDDAGRTWVQVSALDPTRAPTVTTKGAVFYPVKGGLARSTDQGKSWAMLKGPTSGSVIELPDGRLAATGTNICISSDSGETWAACGPPLPVGPSSWGPSLVYLPGRKSFMMCAMAWSKKMSNAVWRMDVPKETTP